jgi:hypothetical protein
MDVRWLAGLGAALLWQASAAPPGDPFLPLRPCVGPTARETARLQAGETVVRTLPETGGYVAVFGARRVRADADRLTAWVRDIARFKRGPLVEAIARFSDPPVVSDLLPLTLDTRDLEALRRCRPGDCDIKLTEAEMARVPRGRDASATPTPPAEQEAMRGILFDRVVRYRAGGFAALGQYADGRSPLTTSETARALVDRSRCVGEHLPHLLAWLQAPWHSDASVESFLYWSKERLSGRTVISATQVGIARGRPPLQRHVVVAGQQLFATHYLNGSLNLTALLDAGDGAGYLVVITRSQVDVIRGLFGGVVRSAVERRLRSELAAILEALARRLESGPPG